MIVVSTNLVDPDMWHKFQAKAWEREPYHVARADCDYYADLFTTSDQDHLLALPFDRSRMVVSRTKERPIQPQMLRTAYDLGYTIVITNVDELCPKLSALKQAVGACIPHRIACNIFLTPPYAQGFPGHWDNHDIFALQVLGQKHWVFHVPTIECPILKSKSLEIGLENAAREYTTEMGDLLYFPRGWIHQAVTTAQPSAHITFGIHVVRWVDFLVEALVRAAAQHVEFRHAVPLELDPIQLRALIPILTDSPEFWNQLADYWREKSQQPFALNTRELYD